MSRIAVLMALAMPGVAAPSSALAVEQAQADWTAKVVRTAEGGFLMGNPDAPVRLVEFVSMTCGHCAHFHKDASKVLTSDYVATGKVSLEIRNFTLNFPDRLVTAVARCSGDRSFFTVTGALLERQADWKAAFSAATSEQAQPLVDAGDAHGLAALGGVDDIAREAAGAAGADEQAVRSCVNDPSTIGQIVQMGQEAHAKYGVSGTPSFLINDRLVPVHDWSSLKPLIDTALAE